MKRRYWILRLHTSHRLLRHTATGAVTLADLPMGIFVAHRETTFCVADFPKGKLPQGNFHGYVKKNKRITHDSSRSKFYGLIRTRSGLTNHEKVKYTKKSRSRVVCVLRPSWRQILRETLLKVRNHSRILNFTVNVFMFDKFKAP